MILEGLSEPDLKIRPNPDKWSIHEQIAHLGAYQPVFLNRMRRILTEDSPAFEPYVADHDPHFKDWVHGKSTELAVREMDAFREEILSFYADLDKKDADRKGLHPRYGLLSIHDWMGFFLLHEGHHLFNSMVLKGAVLKMKAETIQSSNEVK